MEKVYSDSSCRVKMGPNDNVNKSNKSDQASKIKCNGGVESMHLVWWYVAFGNLVPCGESPNAKKRVECRLYENV